MVSSQIEIQNLSSLWICLSGGRLATVRPHLLGDPCPSGSEPLILPYNFGILHILSQNARFRLYPRGQLACHTLYVGGGGSKNPNSRTTWLVDGP